MTTIHGLRAIPLDRLTACDLRDEVEAYDPDGVAEPGDITAYGWFDDRDNWHNAVLFRDPARIGICWGGPSDWGDVPAGTDPDDLAAIERVIVASFDDEDWGTR